MKSIHCFVLLAFLFTSILGYSQNKIRIACVGNSINYGARIENRETNSYPAHWASCWVMVTKWSTLYSQSQKF